MGRIIFIVESIFNKRDYNRFGIDLFLNKGFEVVVWDFSPVLRNKYFLNYLPPDPINFKNYSLIESKSDAIKIIDQLSIVDIVVCMLRINEKNIFIFNLFSKKNINYGFFLSGSIPEYPTISLGFLKKQLKKIVFYGKRIISFSKKIKIQPANFIMVSGTKSLLDIKYHGYPLGINTNIIKAHSYDYDSFLLDKKNSKNEDNTFDNYAIFLDQFAPHHSDFSEKNNNPYGNPEKYFPPLNKFFDYVENESKTRVIIAAHPRSNYKAIGNPYDKRKIIYGETLKLVKNAKFIFSHCSTSIGFAVLYKKPILILTNKIFSKPLRQEIRNMASVFGGRPIELSNISNLDLKKFLVIKDKKYHQYRESLIKISGSPEKMIWEIFTDYIEHQIKGNFE